MFNIMAMLGDEKVQQQIAEFMQLSPKIDQLYAILSDYDAHSEARYLAVLARLNLIEALLRSHMDRPPHTPLSLRD